MSSKHTPNYNLSQWESEDKVLRTDFNEDNAKIDAALKALQGAVDIHGMVKAEGTYIGVYPSYTANVGFQPSMVIIVVDKVVGDPVGRSQLAVIFTRRFAFSIGTTTGASIRSTSDFKINSNGFTVGQEYSYNTFSYHYLAIK